MKAKRKQNKALHSLYIGLAALLVFVTLVYNPLSVRIMTIGVAVSYKLNPVIFYRLIRTESAFRSLAVSRQNAIGLGQIRQSTAHYIREDHDPKMLYSPLYNLKTSAKYIVYLKGRFNDNWSLVLAAYNWGETLVERRMAGEEIKPGKDYRSRFRDIPETYDYIGKILGQRKKA